MDQSIGFDPELIRRYDVSGPRYTSYPTAVQFDERLGPDRYAVLAAESNRLGGPLSLYFHIPFCDTVCFYCACNKVITRNRKRSTEYLDRLHTEIAMQGALFDRARSVRQLHWGGGTPTFISHDEMSDLMAQTREHFRLLDDDSGEYSVEVDPRSAGAETIRHLRQLGFNRLSMGVQDFEPRVQVAVNRIQPREVTLQTLQAARDEGFRSVSVDLIYGLPLQSVDSFAATLDAVIDLGPDRLSVFNYAHLPQMFKTQRQIREIDLPAPDVKLGILEKVIERLTGAGYVYIGMDHFAKPSDELARAQREGTLYRNFQGYSTHSDCDLVALGASSIGIVGASYSQNRRALDDYYACIDAGGLAVFRGVELTADDQLRRDVITRLICDFELDFAAVGKRHDIDFDSYFAAEVERLTRMEEDGLLDLDASGIRVKPAGRLLIRNVCMVFDRYLRGETPRRFSKVI